MGASAAFAAVMIVGGMMQSNKEKELAAQQGRIHDYNAKMNERLAADAEKRGYQDEMRHRSQTNRLIGDQRAAFAASGVDLADMDSTASNVFGDTAYLSELDAITIRENAAREAWGYRTRAQNDNLLGDYAREGGDARALGIMTSSIGNVLYGRYGFSNSSTRTAA